MTQEPPSAHASGSNVSLGTQRLFRLFFSHSTKSIREQAEVYLFVAGLLFEYSLLYLVFSPYAQAADTAIGAIAHYFVMLALYFALFVHQFLIFRNYSLHHSLSNGRVRPLELLICLLFGVLTGEVGYLIVLALCAFPETLTDPVYLIAPLLGTSVLALLVTFSLCADRVRRLGVWVVPLVIVIATALTAAAVYFTPPSMLALSKTETTLTWYFAKAPLELGSHEGGENAFNADSAIHLIYWFMHALAVLLKAVFTVGAIAMSVLVLVWDILCGEGFHDSSKETGSDQDKVRSSYKTTKVFFYIMDVLACLVWTAILGMILPGGFLTTPGDSWTWVMALSLSYGAVALVRLAFAARTLEMLANDAMVEKTVV